MAEPWTRASVDRAMLLCWAVADLEKAGKVPHFNAAVEFLAKDCSRQTVSRAHDIAELEGFLTSEWRQREDKRHVRAFVLTPLGVAAADRLRKEFAIEAGVKPDHDPGACGSCSNGLHHECAMWQHSFNNGDCCCKTGPTPREAESKAASEAGRNN